MDAQLLNSHPTGTTTGTAHRPPYAHCGQALTFDLATEIHHLHQEEIWTRTGHNARTLYKDHDLRMVLIAMKGGARLDEHIVAGRLAITVLGGQLRMQAAGQHIDLPAGRLMTIDYAVHYEIEAEEESAFLLTVAYTARRDDQV